MLTVLASRVKRKRKKGSVFHRGKATRRVSCGDEQEKRDQGKAGIFRGLFGGDQVGGYRGVTVGYS